jgi:hypothetical protein
VTGATNDYDPAKRPLKDRVRWRIPKYVSRFVPPGKRWTYITLGGPGLHDVKRLLIGLKRSQYPHQIISVYHDPDETAEIVRTNIRKADVAASDIQLMWRLKYSPRIIYGTVASLKTDDIDSDLVVMFLDYEGNVLKFQREIASCVTNSVLGADDLLFVTSCVNEKFFEGKHHFRREAQTKVSELVRVPYDQVTSEDVLKLHDLNVIRSQVRKASFGLTKRLDCVPIGPLLLYQDTVRMLFLPLRIISEHRNPAVKIELEALTR